MLRALSVLRYFLYFYVLQIVSFQSANSEIVKNGEVRVDSPEACASVNCDRGAHCVKRKFWCKHPPCPNMLYCSKTRRDSWKGPLTCNSVRCSTGYNCLVKVHRCRWGQKCRQERARCVPEREYLDSPASCVGFQCRTGHRCILCESPCTNPPCKLVKSCAKTEDVKTWHNRCKSLGCPSEYECFLRKPSNDCSSLEPCKHTSDCTINNLKKVQASPNCRGWVCPRNQECSALHIPESCDPEESTGNCKVHRTCRSFLNTTLSSSASSIPSIPTTATNIQNNSSQMKSSEVENEKGRVEIKWEKTDVVTGGSINSSLLESIEATEKSDTIPTESYHRQPDHSTKQFEPTLDAGHAPTPTRKDLNCNRNESLLIRGNWAAQIEPWNQQRRKIYRTPVYVRSTVRNNLTGTVEPSCQDQRTDPSITEWLNHLRLKTGVDAVDVWAKRAEENKEHGQFNEWLESVRFALGSPGFQAWLTEFQKSMSGYPAFQDWLSTTKEIIASTEYYTNGGSEATESPFDGYGTSVTDYRSSSTLPPLIRNESKLNSLTRSDDDPPLIVSVAQPSSDYPLDRKNVGHPRINYGLNPRNAYQQIRRGYIKSHPNSSLIASRNESLTGFGEDNSTRVLSIQKEGNGTTVSKLGDFIEISKSDKYIETNSSQDDDPAESLKQQDKSLENDTTLNYDLTNHSMPVHKSEENVPKLDHTPIGLTDKENEESDRTNSTPVSPVDFLKKSEENSENNTRQDYRVDPLNPDVVRDGQSGNFSNDEKHGVDDLPTKNYEDLIPTTNGPGDIPPESNSRTKLKNFSVNKVVTKKTENPTEERNLFDPVADGVRVESPWNALKFLDPSKKTYYAILKLPQENVNEEAQIIGYPLIMSKTSPVDRSNNFYHIENVTPNSESNVPQSKMRSSNSWNQILGRKQILRKVVPQISYPLPLGEKGEQIDSRNQKSSSQRELEQHKPVTFKNSSEFVPLQDNRTAQKQRERNLSLHEVIIPNNQSQQMEQLPHIYLKSLTVSPEPQNPNYEKVYRVIQDPKSPLQSHEDETVREKQTPTQQRQEASLPSAFSNGYPHYKFQQSALGLENTDPTSWPQKNFYQGKYVSGYHPGMIDHYSLDSPLPNGSPSPANLQNERIADSESGFEAYRDDLNLQEYVDTYLDAFIEDAVLKVLIGESLQDNETPYPYEMRSENSSRLSKIVYDTITEAIDDKYPKTLPQLKTTDKFSNENHGNGFGIPHSVGTVERIDDIPSGGLQQATIAPIPNPSTSPILMEIDYQSYDCYENENLQQSPTVEIVKSSITEDGYNVGSENYGTEEYYYEDDIQREYLAGASRYQDAENSGNHEPNITDYHDSHYYDDEK